MDNPVIVSISFVEKKKVPSTLTSFLTQQYCRLCMTYTVKHYSDRYSTFQSIQKRKRRTYAAEICLGLISGGYYSTDFSQKYLFLNTQRISSLKLDISRSHLMFAIL